MEKQEDRRSFGVRGNVYFIRHCNKNVREIAPSRPVTDCSLDLR